MLALKRLQLLISPLFQILNLLLMLTFELLLLGAGRLALQSCMLALEVLQLLTVLLVDGLKLPHVLLEVVLLLPCVLGLEELLLGGVAPLDHLKVLGVLSFN